MDTECVCTICDKAFEKESDVVCTVHEKGLKTFTAKSRQREDNKWQLWIGKTSVTFHDACRKRYSAYSNKPPAKKAKLATTDFESEPSSSSSTENSNFNFTESCFICGNLLDRIHKTVHTLTEKHTLDRIINLASLTSDNDNGAVVNRLMGLSLDSSLKSNNPSYHLKCYKSFIKASSEQSTNSEVNSVLKAHEIAFQQICDYIKKSENFKFPLNELKKIVEPTVITEYVLFKKLREKYGEDIFIAQHVGRSPVVYKTVNIGQSCKEWLRGNKVLGDTEKKIVLHVAAQILRADIEKASFEIERYPPASKFLDNVESCVPESLNFFLGDLLTTDQEKNEEHATQHCVKRYSIAHSIISMLRPKSFISNLQLAVGTYIHRKTGSKLTIDILSKLGISASYYNIQLYEASVIMDPPKTNLQDVFVQHIFDNTDHNASTLDGKETFHCLGGIAVYTPDYNVEYEGGSKKCTKMPSASELASQKQIRSIPHGTINSESLKKIIFVNTNSLAVRQKRPLVTPCYAAYFWCKAFEVPNIPSWKGFFEVLSSEITYDTSHISCLPFINQPPSNLTTLNTALNYAAEECRRLNQKTCFVTFDQPLYYKARCIVAQNEELGNVIVRLGGFHLLMSYLGAIGYVMDGSGLEDLWATVYAPESVRKMLSGHAFSRATRAHILTFSALGIIICKSINTTQENQASIHEFFKKWSTEPPSTGDCNADQSILDLQQLFAKQMDSIESRGPTAKLWMQYFKCNIYALQFIESERTGDWDLHLQSIRNMLPLFYAAGHFAYAKCAQIYLQDMANLEITMDEEEFKKFTTDGYFTIRRSDKAWSGVWSDMVIEQTLNRFFGTDLKHGRGITSSVVARYLLAMPSAFHVMDCLENYVGLKSASSEQHIDLSKSRLKKDHEDIEQLVFWLNEHSPFKVASSLISLSTGIIAGPEINCHMAIEKGLEGMELMVGKDANNITLTNLYKVKPISVAGLQNHLTNETHFAIDSFLLFQRSLVFLQENSELGKEALSYELSPYPLSLFDEQGLMRKSAKSELYKFFKPCLQSGSLLQSLNKVVDGGWLLHHVVWPHSKTYIDLFELYASYVIKHFGQDASVVFDGYNSELIGTKSYERYRRKEKSVAADVEIAEDRLVTQNQTKFLANAANKFKFVELLSAYLTRRKINTKVASEDADTLIVNTALQLIADGKSVAVVGNDIDLLILCIALASPIDNIYFYKITSSKKGNELFSSSDYKHMKRYILFAHAFSGCDTTSALFSKGKRSTISVLEKNIDLQDLTSVFCQPNITENQLYEAAEQFTIHLYDSKNTHKFTIGELRYKMFTSSIITMKKKTPLATLPPTESSLRQHVKRVYLQVQHWLGNPLIPEKWGWKRTSFMLLPILNEKPPAPQRLLENVFCGCKTDCTTTRCTCKKAGLFCTQYCKHCNGQSCDNASSNREIIEFDEIEEIPEPENGGTPEVDNIETTNDEN